MKIKTICLGNLPCEDCAWFPLQPKWFYDGPHATMHGAEGGVSHGEAAAVPCPGHHHGGDSKGARATMMCCCFRTTCPSPW